MSQLRWSLLILGLAFIAVLGWWERRRPRQGRTGDTGLRPPPRLPRESVADTNAPRPMHEPPLELPEIRARGSLASNDLPVLELTRDQEDLPVLSAAESATAARADPPRDADSADADLSVAAEPTLGELPAEAGPREISEPAPPDLPGGEQPVEAGWVEEVSAAREVPREKLPEIPPTPAPLVDWPPDTERRVVALRLVATQPERFAGRSLRQALAAEGFVLGRFAIFHKPDEEQRAVVSAASLTRPGTFDPQTMDSQHYGGLSLFSVLPGPRPLPETFEELVATARSLNQRLQGMLQDEAGSPLTPARIASLREHLGRETPA